MRLIDADVIRAKLIEYIGLTNGFDRAFNETPTIDAVSVVHGKWIKHDEERDYCSVCKHIFRTRALLKQNKWTTYVDDLGYNFCPNCGARMKGEREGK